MCTETTGCSPFGSTLAPGWVVYLPPVDGEQALRWCPEVKARTTVGCVRTGVRQLPADTEHDLQPSRNGMPDGCEQER